MNIWIDYVEDSLAGCFPCLGPPAGVSAPTKPHYNILFSTIPQLSIYVGVPRENSVFAPIKSGDRLCLILDPDGQRWTKFLDVPPTLSLPSSGLGIAVVSPKSTRTTWIPRQQRIFRSPWSGPRQGKRRRNATSARDSSLYVCTWITSVLPHRIPLEARTRVHG